MFRLNKNLPAFTLVELLVVISISTIFLTLGFSAYHQTQNRQTLHNAAKKTEAILRSIQKKAESGDKDCQGFFRYYHVHISPNSNTITSQAICKESQGNVKTYTLQEVKFVNGCTLHFRTLSQGLNIITPNQSSFDLTLQLETNPNLTTNLKIAKPGLITANNEN